MVALSFFVPGLLLGLLVGWLMARRSGVNHGEHTETVLELLRAEEAKSSQREADFMQRLQASFGQLSLDSMAKTTDQLAKLTAERLEGQSEQGAKELEGKKQLIDAQLKRLSEELERVKGAMGEGEKSRAQQFAQLTEHLKQAAQQTETLGQHTKVLGETLGSNQARGQWGERMAEDILRSAGFMEHTNYLKQDNQGGVRPDFTFMLPQGFVVNMDVKFPYANFVKVVETAEPNERERYAKAFMSDVRNRLKEVGSKAYIDPDNNTVDYVLLFIPNEQIYGFMHQREPGLLDEALRKRIILCSPSTLFVVLAVIRQAMDSFKLQERSDAILTLMGGLRLEWENYSEEIAKLARQYETVGKTFEKLCGPRKNQLARQFKRLDAMSVEDEPPVRLVSGGSDDDLER